LIQRPLVKEMASTVQQHKKGNGMSGPASTTWVSYVSGWFAASAWRRTVDSDLKRPSSTYLRLGPSAQSYAGQCAQSPHRMFKLCVLFPPVYPLLVKLLTSCRQV